MTDVIDLHDPRVADACEQLRLALERSTHALSSAHHGLITFTATGRARRRSNPR